jgi:hypothetical protein
MTTPQKKFPWLVISIGAVLALAAGVWISTQNWPWKSSNAPQLSQTDPLLPTSPVSHPATPPDGYVGSAACADCHADLCKSFAQHPMGRSSALTPGSADLEVYSLEKATFQATDGTRYKAEKVGNKVLHHEIGTDAQDRTLYDLSVPVSLAIGSGTRGKTYGVNRDGILLQSPITWYSTKGGYFQLSPGYENIATNPRFSRRLIEDCLVCHVGRMEFDPDVPDKLLPPYFHELAIGCERCHGPGEKHVAAQQAQKSPSPDPTIVNPVRLPMRERESVCNQCHLHGEHRGLRYGRHPRDFRPGMAIEDVYCILVKESSTTTESKAVSQVEQMRESVCFKSNPNKLGCTSCHDPHEWSEPQKRAEYYRSRCNECHADRGCSLPVDRRTEQQDSCIACHMPRTTPKDVVHASQTDHRVLKNPEASPHPVPRSGTGPLLRDLQVYDDGDKRLPQWEVQRVKGIIMAQDNISTDPQEALSLLLPLTDVALDDVPLRQAIGTIQLNRKDYVQARKWLEQAAAVEPKNEYVQILLAQACSGMGDHPSAKEHIAVAVKINPFVASNFAVQAQVLVAAGDHEQALRAAEKVIALDPTQTALRDWILKAHGK